MNKALKRRWLRALRSGEFKQGKGWLEQSGHYCCLGVLCAIQRQPDVADATFKRWGHESVMPPRGLRAGLSVDDMEILMDANDGHGWTFDDIAAYVEAML